MSMIGQSNLVIINDGTFTQHVASSESLPQAAFEKLTKAVALGAFHNSGERFDPPKCHPRTRIAITERIMNWILGKESTNDFIVWLHGPAGAGKSAIAQRIAELCHEAKYLLASFFFSKSDSRRNRADLLFPTISYQIACAFPGARAMIEQEINRDPLILTRSLEAQIVGLIVNPLKPLIDSNVFADPTSRRLIILDGLDEVVDRQEQARILQAISNVLSRNQMPLVFIISSRPEQEILHAFSTEPLSRLTTRLLLDATFQPDEDIRIFLDDSFADLKAEHPQKRHIPPSWPSSNSLDHLVEKSSGQFIYASTVIRFVKSLRHRPVERLEVVLGLRPVHRDLPFAELDALYMHILSALEFPDRTLQLIGVILVASDVRNIKFSAIHELEQFLGLESGDVEFYLADMSSLISCNDESTPTGIRILHASFSDFLLDPSRSGAFTIDRTATEL
ncbi:hypothetical protein HYPSUDRAFT_203066 [Hypholoma sublateritium FD-334 SS-4]|uniref:NACHT domain-containing protein n=1 Tax=Hypholoma sublateritium (strain FD-334 SS-4) TaxID=945553 RepID=A0A0D2NXU2_HYPSF|nr:hypothetical protein HYPSUDRAFT_203066 [Hypholoma sublateritium FD-334 SS-4]